VIHLDRRDAFLELAKIHAVFFLTSSRIGGERIQRVCMSAVERALASSFVAFGEARG
jgi:hypothetical protein